MNAHTPDKPFQCEAQATALPVIEAFAERCYSLVRDDPDFTRITLYAPHRERGSVFIGNVDGWLADGAIHPIQHHGKAYRLTLVPTRGRVPWWREAA